MSWDRVELWWAMILKVILDTEKLYLIRVFLLEVLARTNRWIKNINFFGKKVFGHKKRSFFQSNPPTFLKITWFDPSVALTIFGLLIATKPLVPNYKNENVVYTCILIIKIKTLYFRVSCLLYLSIAHISKAQHYERWALSG